MRCSSLLPMPHTPRVRGGLLAASGSASQLQPLIGFGSSSLRASTGRPDRDEPESRSRSQEAVSRQRHRTAAKLALCSTKCHTAFRDGAQDQAAQMREIQARLPGLRSSKYVILLFNGSSATLQINVPSTSCDLPGLRPGLAAPAGSSVAVTLSSGC